MFEQIDFVRTPRNGARTPVISDPEPLPTENRRKTRMQTRAEAAARAERLQQLPTPPEPVIHATRYSIRKQPINVDNKTKSRARMPKATKGKRNTSRPPVTQEDQQMSSPAPVARQQHHTKNRRVQTDNIITEEEFRFLKSLRAKRIDVRNVKIVVHNQEHILIADEEMPFRPQQMPIRHGPPLDSIFSHDISRYIDDEPQTNQIGTSGEWSMFMDNYLNAQFLNQFNLNMYGFPGRFPNPNYNQNHAPWGP